MRFIYNPIHLHCVANGGGTQVPNRCGWGSFPDESGSKAQSLKMFGKIWDGLTASFTLF